MIRDERQVQGFTVLEVLVAMMLAVFVSSLVFNIFNQEHMVLRTVAAHEDIDSATALILRQLAHDLAGVWQPIAIVEKQTKSSEAAEGAEGSQEASAFGAGGKAERALELKQLMRAFVAAEKNNQFDELTFITENPLSRFVAPLPQVRPKPQMVRVTYQLKDKKLLRSEVVAMTQSNAPAAKTQPIMVADNIISMVFSYVYTSSSEKEMKVHEQPTWDSDLFFASLIKKEKGKQEEKIPMPKIPPLPSMVKVRITISDALRSAQHTYSYLMPIPTARSAFMQGAIMLQPPGPGARKQQLPPPPGILNKTPERAKQFNAMVEKLANTLGIVGK